jgi:hypothetical protein
VTGWVAAEGGAGVRALAKIPHVAGFIDDVGAGVGHAVKGPWNAFGRQWRLIFENRNGSYSLWRGNRFKYDMRNLIFEPRKGPRGFADVSRQYWRGGADGNSLQHLWSTNTHGILPDWFRNSGLNLMEIPRGLNTWAGGRLPRELGIRFVTAGLGATVGFGSYFAVSDLQGLLNRQDGGEPAGC